MRYLPFILAALLLATCSTTAPAQGKKTKAAIKVVDDKVENHDKRIEGLEKDLGKLLKAMEGQNATLGKVVTRVTDLEGDLAEYKKSNDARVGKLEKSNADLNLRLEKSEKEPRAMNVNVNVHQTQAAPYPQPQQPLQPQTVVHQYQAAPLGRYWDPYWGCWVYYAR